ncbi:MAG: T9SS type A sorting domain-containing protein [Bacteroidota bacterium]
MKRIIMFLSLCTVLIPYKSWAVQGEFIIYQTGNPVQLKLQLQSSGYAWLWKKATGKVVLSPTYIQTFYNNNNFGFACPKSQDVGTNGFMPWGLMQFTLSSSTASDTFMIDFRDENWATAYVPSADIYLYFNPADGTAYLHPPSGSDTPVTNGKTINIWDAYHQENGPLQTDLLPPVFLTNLINSANATGTLHVASSNYNSGDTALAAYNNSYNIGTMAKGDGINVDRFPNYQSSGITYKHNNWRNVASDDSLNRMVFLTSDKNQQFANFNPLYAAILCNSLDGTVVTGTSGGYIPFVDPWYVDANGNQTGQSVNITSGSFPTGAYSQSSGGVFLNQDYNIAGNPHYSVQAPVSQPINNLTAFFGGWSASPSSYVTFQNATSPTTALVFNSAGATVTANYIYSVVASNATLEAGTYSFAGSLTINSGATLTLTSGTTLNFPAGANLVVNGTLVANGVTFNFTQYYSYSGITINADGSSLTNCTISGADQPLSFTNVNTATVNSCTINNSLFSSSQAINVSNSTPDIENVQIIGQSGSWNGVRYTNGGGGTLNGTTIQNLGAGNGIVIQGNPNPTISDCSIDNNYFYGIISIGPTTGVPLITGNDFNSNGTHGSTKQYFNLYFENYSWGTVQSNYITGSLVGVGSYYGSSVTAGSGQKGWNTIVWNDYNIICRSTGSSMGFGSYSGRYYSGTCNTIYGGTYDAYADEGATIIAEYNWWNEYPPDASKITTSTVDYSNYLVTQGDCPGGGGDVIVQGGSSLSSGLDSSGSASQLYQRATNAFLNKNYSTSTVLCRLVLKRNASVLEKQQALVRLLSVFLQSGDTTIVADLKSHIIGSDSVSETAEELLAKAYVATGKTSNAVSLANDLISKNPGTEIEKQALLLLASLRAYDKSAESISARALKDVKERFGSSLDQGLMAALTTASDVANSSANKEAVQKTKVEAAVKEYGIGNYPNPFNPATTISYQIPKDGRVTIKIFDAIGREVTTLVDEFKPAGRYTVQFNASRLSSGIYFYSIRSGDYNAVKKMSLIK